MRKLSLLLVLAILMTVGGVYATWNYAGTKFDSVSKDLTLSITNRESNMFTGRIEFHDTLVLKIDDESANIPGAPKYTPGWDDYVTDALGGEFTIDFIASDGLSYDAKIQYVFTIENNTYTDPEAGEVAIFEFDPIAGAASNVFLKGEFTCLKSEPSQSVTWSLSEFQSFLKVNDDFQLDDTDQYDAYALALKGVKITCTVSEITA